MDTILIDDLSKEYEINNTDYELIKELKFYKTNEINNLNLYFQYKTANSDTGWKIEVEYNENVLTATGTIADSASDFTNASCGIDISTLTNGYCSARIYFKQNGLALRGINIVLI